MIPVINKIYKHFNYYTKYKQHICGLSNNSANYSILGLSESENSNFAKPRSKAIEAH